MQKKLAALAVLAACSAWAQADELASGVTLSGHIRAGVLLYNGNANAAWGFSATPANASTTNVVGRGDINFNGDENLGNGLHAIWQVNNRFSPTGNGYNENGSQTNTFANDDTFVGLKGSFGALRLGKGTGNVEDGKYDATIWAGPDQRLGWFGGGTGNNMVRYDLPALGNFYGSLQYSTDENKTATKSGSDHVSVNAGYETSVWGVSATVASNSNQTNANANNPAQLGTLNQYHLTAMVKPIDELQLAVEFEQYRLPDSSKQTATALYAYYTIGSTQLGLQGGSRKDNSPKLVQGNEKFVDAFVHYNLSKRTMAYVELMSDKPQDGSGKRTGTLMGMQTSF